MATLPGTSSRSSTGSGLNLIRKHRDELLSSMISNPDDVQSLMKKIDSTGLLFPDAIRKVFMTNPSLTNDDCAVAILNHLEIILEISYGYIPPVVQVLKEHSFLTDTIAIDDTDMLTANEFMYFSKKIVAKQKKKILASDGELSCNSDFDLETQAENLQKLFNQVYPVTIRALNDGSVNNIQLLKAQLNVMMRQFKAEQNVGNFFSKLETKNTSGEIFHLLMTRKYLGFLNLQFLPLFEPFLPDDQGNDICHKIEVCRKQHREFFSNSISNLAELFDDRGDLLNPASGLPNIKFTLQLDKWGEKSFIQWNNLLVKLCGWPDCFLFKNIEESGTEISIEYSILPFMVSRVVNTFLDKEISQTFEKFDVSYVVAGTELERKAADETAWIHTSVQETSELVKKMSSSQVSKLHQRTTSSKLKKNRISQASVTNFQFDSASSAGGFQKTVFVKLPPENLHCSFCNLVMRNPVQTECCGETMCKACLQENLQENNICPECGIKNPVPVVDKRCQRLIRKLEAQCTEEDCDWKGTLADYESHVKEYHSQQSFNETNSSDDEKWAKPQQNVKGQSQWRSSSSSLVKPKPPPMPKPRKPSASVTLISLPIADIRGDLVRLSWEKPKITNPPTKMTYTVYYCTEECIGDWTDCGTTATELLELKDLPPNETHYFKVKASDTRGITVAESKSCKVKIAPATQAKTTASLKPPKADSVTGTTVTLSWEKPKINHGKLKYVVSYCTANDINEWHMCKDVNTNSMKVKDLNPREDYYFKVKVFNNADEIAESRLSELVKIQSLISAPTNLRESGDVSDKTITIEWNQSRGKVQAYNVLFAEKDAPQNWNSLQTRDRKVTVHGLTPDTHYLFKIQGQNGSDVSQSSETIEVKTHPAPLPPPGKPYSLSIESESIELSWDPPESSLKLKEYQLVVCTIPDHTKFDSFSSMKNNKYIVKNLSPGTEYSFFVKAIYSNGFQSEWSECSKAICTTFKNIREKPTNSTKITNSLEKPKMKDVTSSSIRLEWRPSDNQTIKKYIVFYSKKEGRHGKSVKTQDDTPKITIAGLDHSTEYFFKVKAKFLNKQYSDYSEESDAVKTLPLCASPPGIPHAVQCPDAGSLMLRWNKPKHGANAVKHYLVQYATTSEKCNKNRTSPDAGEPWPNFQEQYTSAHAKINDLEPGINYCFKIAAICDGGCAYSDPTQWIRVKYPPPTAPGMPYATAVEETTIHLKWERPEYKYQIKYNVHCLQTLYSDVTCRLIQNEEAEIPDLKPNKKYRFQIEAVNPDGVSKSSPESDPISTNRKLPNPPGRPYVLRVTHDMVKLGWEDAQNMVNAPSHYKIQFKLLGERPSNWNQKKTKNGDNTNFEVNGLKPSAKYVFKVSACYKDGESVYSDVSQPVTLKSAVPSAPGKPVGKPDSSNPGSVMLTWSKPQNYADQIKLYEISYYQDSGRAPNADNKKIETLTTKEVVEKLRINKLTHNEGYYFEVRAVTHGGDRSEASFLSDLITSVNLAEKFLPKCALFSKEPIPIYLIPKEVAHKDEKNMLVKYDIKFGQERTQCPKDKVLMLVGATGSGKTTIINGLVNYLLRVEYGNEFRYKLIHDSVNTQVKSVTTHISAYTIYFETGFPVSFNLTIIDTPGFGDTGGIERDKQTVKQVKHFFEMENGIPHLDGIGFVCQAGSNRLTPTQLFIFNSIFAMFGNDVKDNIFVMCTFCDGAKPGVIEALKEANIPADYVYKFNNSALYQANDNKENQSWYWNIGSANFQKFFTKFERASPVSLKLTQEVLQERETLETVIIGLQERTVMGMSLLNQLRDEIKILEDNRSLIEANKNFEYEVSEDTMKKVDLENGTFVTNCLKCNMTCHWPCIYANDEDKKRCSAMKRNGEDDASCQVCPKGCQWIDHRNAEYRMITEKKTKKKEYANVKKNFEVASNAKMSLEDVIETLKCKTDVAFEDVFKMIKETHKHTKRLDEIAFRPNHLSDVDYIQLLIDVQLQEKEDGFLDRIQAYRVLQERAKTWQHAMDISEQSKRAEEWDKRWWEKIYMAS